jgi:hypothetical protein
LTLYFVQSNIMQIINPNLRQGNQIVLPTTLCGYEFNLLSHEKLNQSIALLF